MEEPVSFSFVTYNLDSQDFNFEERLYSFTDLIRKDLPDIVVIQEGRKYTYEKLGRAMSQLGYKYKILDVLKEKKTGEVIFSRYDIDSYEFIPFDINAEFEKRGVTVAQLNIMGETVVVATTQLHSTTPIQTKQLNTIPRILRKYTSEGYPVVIGGDFQLSSYQRVDAPKGWEDAWYEQGTKLSTFTVDSERNILVSPPLKDRSDRVWYNNTVSKIDCTDFEFMGVIHQPVISTHFGIKANFVLK